MNQYDSQAPDLLASLSFNLTIHPAIEKALRAAGIAGTAAFPELSSWRASVAAYGAYIAAAPTPYDQHVQLTDRRIPVADGSIRLRVYRPAAAPGRLPVLVWMHGGGMMGGTPEQDDAQMKQVAAETGALVVSVDYRLAPEFPFPTPLQDCYAALLWVVSKAADLGIDADRIAIGGASAGGGLAASLAQLVRASGGPRLVHQSLTYPMLDDRNASNSSRQITGLGVWDRAYNLYGWEAYLGTAPGQPTAPEFAAAARERNLAGLPPAFIAVGALDLFRDEDLDYALRLMAAGVSTELHFYQGAVHGFDWHVPSEPMTHSLLSKRITALKLAFAG